MEGKLEERLESLLEEITGPDEAAMERAVQHWDGLAKPLGSLGLFEEMIVRIAGVQGTPDVEIDPRQLLVFCADNGVVREGVSQSDQSVTEAVAAALGKGTSSVNFLAGEARCPVVPVDIGMAGGRVLPGVRDLAVRRGTGNIRREPAMTRRECLEALLCGADLVREKKEEGIRLLLLGEMGIGNTTSSTAVAGVLLGRDPEELTGRGAGLTDEGLAVKVRVIREAIALHKPDPADPIGVLCGVGGLDLAALCGVCLGGAALRVPVLLDGLISWVAALAACRLAPLCRHALLGSHLSSEPAAPLICRELGMSAPIHAGMRLGEGSGAVMALPLLDMALALYRSGHTFSVLGIDAYRKLS